MVLIPPDEIGFEDTVLRRFTADDIEPFGDFMANPENTRFMTFPEEMKNRDAAAAIIRDTIIAYANPTAAMALAICRHGDPTIVGACGGFEIGDTEIEIFYLVFEAHRGRGYATSAATALIDHLRSVHPNHDLAACVAPEHARSKRILEKLDFIDRGPRTVNEKPFRYLVRAAERARG